MRKRLISLIIIFSFLFYISNVALISPCSAAPSLPAPDRLIYPPLQFTLPHAERIVLENGIVLYLLVDHQLPLININALVNTGTMYDPTGKEGVAELTLYLMRTGGTQKFSSTEIDKQFDFLAASPSISIGMDSAQIDLSLLNKDIDQGLGLLSQIMVDPSFEQIKFELAQGLKAEELRRLKDDPQKLAFREFNKLIYRGNPRGKLATLQSLKNIERADLLNFHRIFFQPHNTMFAVTGNITREEAVKKINRFFGNWKSSRHSVRATAPMQISSPGLFYINKEIPQSTLITGRLAPGKNDADYYAFAILDFIIGSGGFSSRIFNAVRNNEGLAYSAGSFYRARSDYGVFAAYAFTKTESTFKTFSLIDSILEKMPTNTITLKEINWAKNSINNGFVFSFTSPEQIAWQQMKIEYDRLPADFLTKYLQNIDSVTLDDVNKIAAKYLNKKSSVVLILGDVNKFGQPPLNFIGHPVSVTPED